jgi:hypothetical protein
MDMEFLFRGLDFAMRGSFSIVHFTGHWKGSDQPLVIAFANALKECKTLRIEAPLPPRGQPERHRQNQSGHLSTDVVTSSLKYTDDLRSEPPRQARELFNLGLSIRWNMAWPATI